jgi:hypothetical protein
MTKEEQSKYRPSNELRQILIQALEGRKFILDCGHHVTFGVYLGNNITIYNGVELKIICSECGY